ncbi:TetR/AcrR family transcriptional regulator [soil metagenome]
MPRAAGQIDLAKNEAILEAAAEVLAERGLSAPMSMIARRASVSKQTIYNHYGAKTDLIRALVARRVRTISAPLDAPGAEGRPEETLAAYALSMMNIFGNPKSYSLMRLTVQSAGEMPELARDVYDAGPRTNRLKLAAFLKAEAQAGRLDIPDPAEAAEIFVGMTIGHRQIRALIGIASEHDGADMERIAKDIAYRFVRAYAL